MKKTLPKVAGEMRKSQPGAGAVQGWLFLLNLWMEVLFKRYMYVKRRNT